MIAIWPAGPPKLMRPNFSQSRSASPNDGCAGALWLSPDGASLTLPIPSRCRRPAMGLAPRRPAPSIERIVHDHAMAQHLVIVRKPLREAEREREQPGRLR